MTDNRDGAGRAGRILAELHAAGVHPDEMTGPPDLRTQGDDRCGCGATLSSCRGCGDEICPVCDEGAECE